MRPTSNLKPQTPNRIFVVLLALLASPALAQGAQYRGETGTFALTDCRIETVTRGTVERGTLVVADGRIATLGASVAVPAGATVIPCNNGTVYPGMIDAGTRIGLQEISAVPVTVDLDEVGDVTPQMRALVSVNPASVHIPVTRLAGVTTALSVPRGGLMPGTAALVNLDGYTPGEMAAGFEGVVVQFPSAVRRGSFDRRTPEAVERAARRGVARLDSVMTQARLYARIDSARAAAGTPASAMPFQPEMAALLPVVRGERALLVEANAAADLGAALDWIAAQGRRQRAPLRAVLTGAAEGWRVAGRIAAAGVPVLAGPVLALPTRPSDRTSRPFENVALLAQAGVPVAIRSEEEENVRNLPFHAGFAAAYGRPFGFGPAEALAAVTIVPARIFGIADRAGSLEVGKDATLFVASGDPFEPATQVTALFIRGVRVPLVSRQTELFDEYLRRGPTATAP